MKKVLIINYHFPPDAAIGAVRFAKFAKYLPEFGWEPVVYTVEESHYEKCDYGKFEDALKALSIYRVKPFPGLLELYSRLGPRNKGVSGTPPRSPVSDRAERKTSPLKRLAGSMMRLPDDRQGWVLNVVKDGYKILKRHKISVFLTSGPPMGTHVGGAILKALTGARWIADFRDPWWGSCRLMAPQFRTGWSEDVTKKLESLVVRNADLVISTAPALTGYFKSLLPPEQGNKCVTITNGFDEDDFSGLDCRTRSDSNPSIRICHAGSLYAGRNPEPFFAALQALALRGDIDEETVKLEFIGDCGDYNGIPLDELVKRYGLGSMVKLTGMMPHRACLQRLMDSDGLLLFAQDFAEQIPAKVFEYLRLGKPTLAIITEGDARNILSSSSRTFMADPHVPGEVEEKFMHMLQAIGKKAQFPEEPEYPGQYDRRTLTGQLAECLGSGRSGLRKPAHTKEEQHGQDHKGAYRGFKELQDTRR